MAINTDHITGFGIGLGVAALGFYFYKKNQKQVDDFLRQHGIEVPAAQGIDSANMTLEELVLEKERLEDTIAEREIAAEQEPVAATAVEAEETPQKRTTKKTAKK